MKGNDMEYSAIVSGVMGADPAFEVECAAIAKAVAFLARHIVERRNSFPILSYVEIMASGNAIRIRACDLDMMATITLPAKVERAGATTLSAATLGDLLKKAGAADYFKIDAGDGKALIVAGRTRQSVPTLPADDFPTIKPVENARAWRAPCDELLADWQLVAPAISTEETRYYLNGICVDPTGEMLAYVATDGHRLSTVKRANPIGGTDARQAIIPRKAVSVIMAALKGMEGECELAEGVTRFRFAAGNLELVTKLVDGTFPDYRRVIPHPYADLHIVDVASAELSLHCKGAGNGKSGPIMLELGAGHRIGQNNPEAPWAAPLVATYQGPSRTIGFNPRYLDQFAKMAPALRLAFADTGSPTRITSSTLPHWEAVLMPVRCDGALPVESKAAFPAITAPDGQAADLFGVEKANGHSRTGQKTGYGKATDCLAIGIAPKPRKATSNECYAYLADYAVRAGLPALEGVIAHAGAGEAPYGVTFGAEYENGDYQDGAYSIPMPGRRGAIVTVETLGDDGIWSEPKPCLNAKGEIAAPVQPKERKAKAIKAKPPIADEKSAPALSVESDAPAPVASITPADPMAREAIASGRMQIIAVGSFGKASPVEPLTAHPDEIGHMGPDNAEIALDAPNAPEIDGNETATGGDGAMAAIMARLDALEARLAGDADAAPIDAIEPPTPAVERVKRSPAHERAIRRAWAERRNARLQRDIARDHMRMREQLSENWQRAIMREKVKRARSVERSRANHRLAKKQIAAKHELLNELFRARADHKALEQQLATAKASPTYMDADGREFADARAMAMQRANEAVERAERIAGRLATAEATVKRQEGAIGAMETRMMEAVGRALRAENALRAIEGREERGGQPYVMGTPIVEFRRAA